MNQKIDWERHLGRRIRLRDLHVLFAVVEEGSMARAATRLGVSQPSVSEVIAGLEQTLGVRLLDRSQRGVVPTIFGQAFIARGRASFDELKQGIRDIEFLANPTAGELRIGCPESLASAVVPSLLQRFSDKYPGIVLHISDLNTPLATSAELRERNLDVALLRVSEPQQHSDLRMEILFQDRLVFAAGRESPWGRRRKLELAELVNERWILQPPGTWAYRAVADAFEKAGLPMPTVIMTTFSVHVRASLLANASFVTAIPRSALGFGIFGQMLKVLPIELPHDPWHVVMATMINRTSSPIVSLFADHIRATIGPLLRHEKSLPVAQPGGD